MLKAITTLTVFMLGSWIGFNLSAQTPLPEGNLNQIEIRTILVGDKRLTPRNSEVNLGAYPKLISFLFFPSTNGATPVTRMRYKLDGYDNAWNDGPGFMFLAVRFFNANGDQISQQEFHVSGDSAGWRGSLKTSALTHRRETVAVPPGGEKIWMVLSSAGPPAAVGTYVVANLIISKTAASGQPAILMASPLDREPDSSEEPVLKDWTRDGPHPSMARIVTIGENPSQRAFAILDNDSTSHAEWRSTAASAPSVRPGDHLLIEWNEMFSIGISDMTAAHYPSLPEGRYVFHAAGFDIYGRPTGVEASIKVVIPPPLWRNPLFGVSVAALLVALALGGSRYLTWRRIRLEVLHLKYQQALGQERLRIAQDIHDDLGARATEISLVSALAKSRPNLPKFASEDFDQISGMCRDLVTALYGTVWAVNPENDNLEALGDYLCQISNRLCKQAQLSCRLQVSTLPRDVEVSSQNRHDIAMAVTEAVHNVIKHASASEVTLNVSFDSGLLNITVQDSGCGFDEKKVPAGNGLTNMKRRLAGIAGTCVVESRPGGGTIVRMQVLINSRQENH